MTPPGCVLDAGAVIGWFVREEEGGPRGADAALQLLEMATHGDLTLHAPELLLAESANVLWKLTRFRDYPVAAALRAVAAIGASPLQIAGMSSLVAPALALAATHGCTVYDATYVALAQTLRLPLLTTDAKLVRRLQPAFPMVRTLE